jgi:peptidoglycan-associated lipoprotein
MNVISSRSAKSLLVLASVALAGCHRVKPEELSAELAKLRAELQTEYQAGDRKVASDLGTRVDGVEARLNALKTELDELSTEFDVTVERMEQAIRFNAPVFFDFADATVRAEDHAVLDRFADAIKKSYPEAMITVEGLTDPAGNATYNRKLGQKRADAVIEYLTMQNGLDNQRLRAVSYGEEKNRLMDAGKGPGEAGLRNRRVVFVIEGNQAFPTTTTTAATTDGTN